MIALLIVKIYVKMLSISLCWRCSAKKVFWVINGGRRTLEMK